MKVFELHFNPDAKSDKIFGTFCYGPKDVYEKRLGHLFMAGELVNALPQNTRFLKNLARVLKTKFYSLKTNRSETCLKKSLQEGNDFLQKITKEGDVSWISNLNFAILNLSPRASPDRRKTKIEKYKLNFTKVGDIKIFLARNAKILDIGQDLEAREIEPYPLKIFFNIISGKVSQGDRILIMTKETSDIFLGQNIVEKIAQSPFLDEKALNQILSNIKKDISGACLLISLDMLQIKEPGKKLIFKKRFSPLPVIQSMFAGAEKQTKRISERARMAIYQIGKKISALAFLSKIRVSAFSKILLPVFSKTIFSKKRSRAKPAPIKQPKLSIDFSKKITEIKKKVTAIQKRIITAISSLKKKNIILVLGFVFLVLLGAFLTRVDENKKAAQIQAELKIIQEKINEGDALLILEEQEKASELFLETLEKTQTLLMRDGLLNGEISQVIEIIETRLFDLNKMEKIEMPELIFDFMEKQFSPQKIIIFNEKVYCFGPYSKVIYELDQQGNIRSWETETEFNEATLIDNADNAVLFLARPNRLFPFQKGSIGQEFSLKPPFEDFEFENLSSFKSNLYFLDSQTCTIVKYPFLGGLEWGSPQVWLQNKAPHQTCSPASFREAGRAGAGAIAVDGNIWVLQENNSIDKYYGGKLQETIEIEIFPFPQALTKIWTSSDLSYLYILEPAQKRIVILDKKGKIVKQYQSEVFDTLRDFAISDNGKRIYLLNGQKLYQINF